MNKLQSNFRSRVRLRALVVTTTLFAGTISRLALANPIYDQYPTFHDFLQDVYQEPDSGIYIVDGDTPIQNIADLEDFYFSFASSSTNLTVNSPGNIDSIWSTYQKRNLTYCVSDSFGANYNDVVNAMASATQAWSRTADLNFSHLDNHDSNCDASNNSVIFDIRLVSGAPYLARAFFPNYSRANRNILIDSSSFSVSEPLTLTGILRHELGHTLGFRHEHTRPESGTCFEDNNWNPLTPYDSNSVMHYPQCNETNSWELSLSPGDKGGSMLLYGPVYRTAHNTQLVDDIFWYGRGSKYDSIWKSDGAC